MGLSREQEFQVLLEAKNHKELIKKLDEILTTITNRENKEIDTSGIEAVIAKLQMAEELKETTNAINAMVNVISKKLEEKKQEEKQWTFKVERNADGFIDVVKATSD